MSKTVSTTVGNPIRTGGQASAGLFIVQVLEAFKVYDFDEIQTGLAVIVFGSLVSLVQNLAENRGWIRAVLRTVPPTETKVVDDIHDPAVGLHGDPVQTDNRERPEDGEQPEDAAWDFTGEMR